MTHRFDQKEFRSFIYLMASLVVMFIITPLLFGQQETVRRYNGQYVQTPQYPLYHPGIADAAPGRVATVDQSGTLAAVYPSSLNPDGTVPTLLAVGTSIYAGHGLCASAYVGGFYTSEPCATALPAVLAGNMGWHINNRALSSSNCGDVMGTDGAGFVPEFPFSTPTNSDSVSLYGAGDNNADTATLNITSEDAYMGCLRAFVLFAGVPNSQIVRPTDASCTYSGAGWSNSLLIAGAPAKQSVTATNSVTCTTPPGKALYVVTMRQFQDGTTHPNVPYTLSSTCNGQTVNTIDPVSGTTTHNTFMNFHGYVAFFQMYAHRLSTPETGCTFTLTLTSGGDGSNPLNFYGYAVVSPSSFLAGGPRVIVAGPIQYTAAGYTSNSTSAVAKTTYSHIEAQIVSQMRADGFNVIHSPNFNNIAYNPTTSAQSDGIHPTQAGTNSLAANMQQFILSLGSFRQIGVTGPAIKKQLTTSPITVASGSYTDTTFTWPEPFPDTTPGQFHLTASSPNCSGTSSNALKLSAAFYSVTAGGGVVRLTNGDAAQEICTLDITGEGW